MSAGGGTALATWIRRPDDLLRSSRPLPRDAIVVRVVACARIGIAVGAAAAGSFVPHLTRESSALLLMIGLLWIPYATAVLFAAARPDNGFALVGGPVADLGVLFSTEALLPGAHEVLFGYVVVVAFGVYTAGRSVATLLGLLAISCAVSSQLLVPVGERLTPGDLLAFSGAVLALLFMFGRTATLHEQVSARAERLQSRSATIVAHVADAVFVTDHQGRVLECNAAAERIVEQRAAGVVGKHCGEILGLHRGERALDCSTRCGILAEFGTQDADLGCELWRLAPDGRRQPLLCNAAVMESSSGQPEIVHSLRDVSRLKEAEEAKTLFLATASHELKTPLTVINGFAETLARFEDLDDPTRLAALEAIRARARELSRIVDRLLMSSRIEAGRINLSVGEFEVVPLLRTRVEAFSTATGRAVRFESAQSAQVLGNEDALVTVIDHLLDNAVKYSPDGQPLNVEVAHEGDHVLVSVSDRGVGMDDQEVAHCFDKFWQAESSDVRRFGGTGIGLYIVQSLVEAMGGTVSVRSARTKGSTFTVSLRTQTPAALDDTSAGESTSIREFMRQIGVPERSRV